MNSELQTIFRNNLIVDNKIIPVSQIKYKGEANTYIVWTIIDEVPALSANDDDLFSIVTVDIDIFSNTNYLEIIKEIKKIMKANEWVWVEDNTEMFDDNTGLYHKTCTFEKGRMIENG